jgi:hypothetical protein
MRSCNTTRGYLRWLASFLGTFFWIFGGILFARDAEVRTTLEVKGDVWVGQGVALVVELLSPGFFAGSPTFYLPRVREVRSFRAQRLLRFPMKVATCAQRFALWDLLAGSSSSPALDCG